MAGNCKEDNEISDSINSGEFRDWLRIGWLLKKDCSMD